MRTAATSSCCSRIRPGSSRCTTGRWNPRRVTLKTDSVVRSPLAKEYNAGSRLYGLVESQLFWVMDMAAMGQELQSHVSAQLKRVG